MGSDLSLHDFLGISKIAHFKEIRGSSISLLCLDKKKKNPNILQEINFDTQETSAFSVIARKEKTNLRS